jgi:hypothetical protein
MSAVPLPSGSLACADCGSLASGSVVEKVISFTKLAPIGGGEYTTKEHGGAVFEFGLCPMHTARRASATELLRVHNKGVRHALGDWKYATELFDGAMVALELMGASAADVDALVATDRLMLKIARELGPLGQRARWAGRFQPPTRPDADSRIYWSEPWEFEDRQAIEPIRAGVERLLHEVAEVPVLMPPPDDGTPRGCLVCGVGAISVRPSEAAQAWGPIRRMPLAALGGRDGAVVEGRLCPEDSNLLGEPPVWSISILDKSLMRFLGAPANSEYEFDNARAWAVDLPNAKPSSERFAYLGADNLAELRSQLTPASQAARRQTRYVKIP